MSPPDAHARLSTARALLSGAALQDADPDPPLADLGAIAGFGAVVANSDVRLSVYVLDAWGAGATVADELRSRAQPGRRLTRVAVNGDLLLIATASADGDATERFLLNDLCSAFAGQE